MVPKCPDDIIINEEIFNPDSIASTGCLKTDAKTCRIGDLNGKHGPISVGVHGSKRLTVADGNLPIHGESVVDKLVVVMKTGSDSEVLGCGVIRMKGPLKAHSVFEAGQHKGEK